jgi:hypothetical protein
MRIQLQETEVTVKKTKNGRVIVRTYSAGVHYGTLVRRDGREVELADARRVWYWRGANTLNEIALRGVASGSKISEPVGSIVLTEAIEIITCTNAAAMNLDKAVWS